MVVPTNMDLKELSNISGKQQRNSANQCCLRYSASQITGDSSLVLAAKKESVVRLQ